MAEPGADFAFIPAERRKDNSNSKFVSPQLSSSGSLVLCQDLLEQTAQEACAAERNYGEGNHSGSVLQNRKREGLPNIRAQLRDNNLTYLVEDKNCRKGFSKADEGSNKNEEKFVINGHERRRIGLRRNTNWCLAIFMLVFFSKGDREIRRETDLSMRNRNTIISLEKYSHSEPKSTCHYKFIS